MKKIITNVIAAACLGGAALFAGLLIMTAKDYRSGQKSYEEIKTIAYASSLAQDEDVADAKEKEPEKPQASGIDEEKLRAINPHYKLWLSIPGTEIDYPVVQCEDNGHYLNHTFSNQENAAGSLFIDSTCTVLGDNTILYGHNMKDGSMFAKLKSYTDADFYKSHPTIRIFLDGKWIDCPIFSCQLRWETDASAYKMDLMQVEWEEYLKEMEKASLYDTGVKPGAGDKVVTLSTCYGKQQRMIVQALIQ